MKLPTACKTTARYYHILQNHVVPFFINFLGTCKSYCKWYRLSSKVCESRTIGTSEMECVLIYSCVHMCALCTRFCIHNLWRSWHLLHALQAIHFGLAFRLIRKLGTIPNSSWEWLNSHKFPKCLSTMCKEVRGIARHRFLRFLVEKGSKKANEFEGSITFPESNGMKTSRRIAWKNIQQGCTSA